MFSRTSNTLLIGFTIVGVLFAATATVQSVTYTRNEPVDKDWRWANLTWTGGAGVISWGAAHASGEPGNAESTAPGNVVFESEPLAHPLYLDAAHLVQLDLFIKKKPGTPNPVSASCGSMNTMQGIEVSLEVGGNRVAGAVLAADFPYQKGPSEELVPPGHSACYYRLPLETTFVPEGAVLRLTVSFVGQGVFQIGSQGAEASVLRFATFTAGEARYRMPEVFPRVREPQEASNAADQVLGAPAALSALGLFAFAVRRHRTRTLLLACLVLAGAFSGCVQRAGPVQELGLDGTVADRDTGDADVQYEEELGEGSNGTIVGRVIDRYEFPVEDARIAILRTSHSAFTDATGIFEFPPLTPATYRLRFDRENFYSMELDVKVPAGKTTRIDAVLAYDASIAAGARPHVHDYWSGENTSVVIKAPLHEACGSDRECYEFDGFYPRPGNDPTHNLIRPGTSEVEVLLEFSANQACTTRLGLMVQDNTDSSPVNWSLFAPRASGEPFHIRTTWEATDVGHQMFSTWTFAVYKDPHTAATPCSADPVTSLSNQLQPKKIVKVQQATLRIHRGAVPLEPSHPDHWGPHAAKQIAQRHAWQDSTVLYPDFNAANLALCTQGVNGLGSFPYVELGPPASVVPVDTKTLSFYANFTRAVVNPQGPVQTYHWELWYMRGDEQPEPFVRPASPYRKAPAPSISSDGTKYVWTIPVAPTEVDGIYNKRSAWRFGLAPDDLYQRCLDQYVGAQTLATSWKVLWDAVVVRDPNSF